MAKIEIYTTPMCPYCWRAKRLLKAKGAAYTEIDLWQQSARRPEMVERSGGRIWATNNVERGATLHFTLPRGDDPSDPTSASPEPEPAVTGA